MNKQKFFTENSKKNSLTKSNMINLEQFINIQRFHKNPIELYQRVEDPFEFARPNRTIFNKKQQFASFVSIGLVKVPQLNLQHKSGISFIPKPTRKLLKKKLNNIVLTSGEQNSSIVDIFSSASPCNKRRYPLSELNFDSPQTVRDNRQQHQRSSSQEIFFPQQIKTEGPQQTEEPTISKTLKPTLIMKSYSKIGLDDESSKIDQFYNQTKIRIKSGLSIKKSMSKFFSVQQEKSPRIDLRFNPEQDVSQPSILYDRYQCLKNKHIQQVQLNSFRKSKMMEDRQTSNIQKIFKKN